MASHGLPLMADHCAFSNGLSQRVRPGPGAFVSPLVQSFQLLGAQPRRTPPEHPTQRRPTVPLRRAAPTMLVTANATHPSTNSQNSPLTIQPRTAMTTQTASRMSTTL